MAGQTNTASLRMRLVLLVLFLIAGFSIGLFLALSGSLTTFLTDRYVASVEKTLSSLRKVTVTIYVAPSIPAETTAYEKNGEVQKIATTFFGDKVQIERNFYYHNTRLRFVHEKANAYDAKVKDYVQIEENWFYFDNGQMVTWLSGKAKEKKSRNEGYHSQEQDVVTTSQELLTGLGPRLAWKKIDPIPLASFLIGKVFRCSFEAGEEGKFEKDGNLPVRLIQEFDFDGNTSRVGIWRLDGEKLTLSGTNISDATFTDFVFEEKNGAIVAEPKVGICGMTIAKDIDIIEQYEDAHIYFVDKQEEEAAQ